MTKKLHTGSVLGDHRKVGKKLIPPFLQLSNVQLTSYIDNTLPCLVWVSALFLRNGDKEVVRPLIEFLIDCNKILREENSPPLVFLNNWDKLGESEKGEILKLQAQRPFIDFLKSQLIHQHMLLDEYPLGFMFSDCEESFDRESYIGLLKEDVDSLLDRRTEHSTKVQTTTFVSMTATQKVVLGPKVNLPDLNIVFTDPGSDEAKSAAAMIRASLNSGFGMGDSEGGSNEWSQSFWKQAFDLEACI